LSSYKIDKSYTIFLPIYLPSSYSRDEKPRLLALFSPVPNPHLLPRNLETINGLENRTLIKMFLIFVLHIFSLNITQKFTDADRVVDCAWKSIVLASTY
jgi:hypothetical protein